MSVTGRITRQKDKTIRNSISEVATEYCTNSTIHGIRYLGANDKTIAERIWWFIVFVVSLVACVYLITDIWIKWHENPMTIRLSQTQSSVGDIPFPAVTICPANKIKKSLYNYTDALFNYKTFTGDKYRQFWDVSLICASMDDVEIDSNATTDADLFDNIRQLTPTLEDTFIYKTWADREEDIIYTREFFVPVFTKEGLCFTFNSLGRDDMFTDRVSKLIDIIGHNQLNSGWSIDDGYTGTSSFCAGSYPDRITQDGVCAGLTVRLRSYENEREYKCGTGTPTSGFKVILHNPADMPAVSEQYILVPINKQIMISVTPRMLTTAKSLLNISPHVRNCYFSHERTLYYFNNYTQRNCKIECAVNITKEKCGCTPFYFPRDSNTTICGFGEVNCFTYINRVIFWFERDSISETNPLYKYFPIYKRCDCLPSCTTLQYTAEISQNDLYWSESKFNSNLESVNSSDKWLEVSELRIFYKDTHFISRHRSELYDKTDLLAKCGGLLGLFLGFSLLSLVEIIYYLTIRLWCRFRNKEIKIYRFNM